MGRRKKRGEISPVFSFPPNLVPRVLSYPSLQTERGTGRREPFVAFSPSSDLWVPHEGQHRRLMISKNLVIKKIITIPLGCRDFRWCILALNLSPFPFCQTGYLPKRGYVINECVSHIENTWLKKRCRLKSINHERYWNTFISKVNSKFFQQHFSFSPAARADANPWSNLFIACRGLFMSSTKTFGSYLMIFKSGLAIWLRSLTIEISEAPATGEDASVPSRKASIIMYTFLKRTLNLQR